MPAPDPATEPTAVLAHRLEEMRGALLAWFRRRVPDPSEAEDLIQESFMRLTQRADPDAIAHLEAYLYRTAQSVLADRHRRRGVRRADAHVPLEPERLDAQEIDPLRSLLAKERLQRVSTVLNMLPERTRAIFILRRVEGMRYGEIAARLKITVSAVEKHMARAAQHLLANMDDAA